MKRFIIEREIPGASELSEAELAEISKKSKTAMASLGVPYRWVKSYVTERKIYCLYQAPSEETLRAHARARGFPAEVIERIWAVSSTNNGCRSRIARTAPHSGRSCAHKPRTASARPTIDEQRRRSRTTVCPSASHSAGPPPIGKRFPPRNTAPDSSVAPGRRTPSNGPPNTRASSVPKARSRALITAFTIGSASTSAATSRRSDSSSTSTRNGCDADCRRSSELTCRP